MAERDVYLVGGLPLSQKMIGVKLDERGFRVVAKDSLQDEPLKHLEEALKAGAKIVIVNMAMTEKRHGRTGRQLVERLKTVTPPITIHIFSEDQEEDIPGVTHTLRTPDPFSVDSLLASVVVVASQPRSVARRMVNVKRNEYL